MGREAGGIQHAEHTTRTKLGARRTEMKQRSSEESIMSREWTIANDVDHIEGGKRNRWESTHYRE